MNDKDVVGLLGEDAVPITIDDVRRLRSEIMKTAHQIRAKDGRGKLSSQDSVYAADIVAADFGVTGYELQSFLGVVDAKNKQVLVSNQDSVENIRRKLEETIKQAQAELEKIPVTFRGNYVYVAHESVRGYVVKQRGATAHRIYIVGDDLKAANALAEKIDNLILRILQTKEM